MAGRPSHRGLRRAGLVALALLVAAAGIAGVSRILSNRDAASTSGAAAGPGEAFADQGAARLAPGAPRPAYNSSPPTSGPHVPVPVARDARRLTDDQLLWALERGNVVLLYGAARPPAGLAALARAVAGPFDPALAQTGQAVILARRAGVRGVTAVAWRHLQRAASADDPALRPFLEHWLGRGRR